MAVFTVHEPAPSADGLMRRAENVAFVREGFSWLAFLFSVPWLLVNRLWWEAAVYVLLSVLIVAADVALGGGGTASNWIVAALGLILGFEARNLVRWRLDRLGYRFLGAVSGRDQEEAERRFFTHWTPAVQSESQIREQAAHPLRGLQGAGPLPTAPHGGRARIDEPVIGFLTGQDAKS